MPINIAKAQLKKILPKIEKGLEKYLWIQKAAGKIDAINNREFQQRFNGFYRVRRNKEWQKRYYSLFLKCKKETLDFEEALRFFYRRTGRVEAAFVSKMVATVNPNSPIIDSVVLRNMNLRLPSAQSKDRMEGIIEVYQSLVKKYREYLATENAKYVISEFKKYYPHTKISKVKILDFILWQMRG